MYIDHTLGDTGKLSFSIHELSINDIKAINYGMIHFENYILTNADNLAFQSDNPLTLIRFKRIVELLKHCTNVIIQFDELQPEQRQRAVDAFENESRLKNICLKSGSKPESGRT